jgi:hypothetical protein
MNMQMLGQPRAGTLADVYTDVKTVRLYGKGQCLLGVPCQFCHFEKLVVAGCVEIRNMPDRGNKQVPIVIGKPVQNRDAAFCPPQDKILVVILRGFDVFAKETLALVDKALNIPDSPRRPEILSLHRFKSHRSPPSTIISFEFLVFSFESNKTTKNSTLKS